MDLDREHQLIGRDCHTRTPKIGKRAVPGGAPDRSKRSKSAHRQKVYGTHPWLYCECFCAKGGSDADKQSILEGTCEALDQTIEYRLRGLQTDANLRAIDDKVRSGDDGLKEVQEELTRCESDLHTQTLLSECR